MLELLNKLFGMVGILFDFPVGVLTYVTLTSGGFDLCDTDQWGFDLCDTDQWEF